MAIPGAILCIFCVIEQIQDWRWQRAWRRGEVKQHQLGVPEKLPRASY